MGSPQKSSVFSSPYFGSYECMPLDDVTMRQQFSSGGVMKPLTPRPSEPVCVTGTADDQAAGQVVYTYPKVQVMER